MFTSPASHFVPLRLALRVYSVASLPRRIALRARILGCFAPSGFAPRYLPHDTPRVLRSVHAKFHHDLIKTMGARGIQTYIHTYIDSPSVTVAHS